MSDRFSGTPSGGGDPYGYYTQPGASGAATGPSQFGTPAPGPYGAPAPSPFGGPAQSPFGGPAQPFGAPAPAGFGYGGTAPTAAAKHGVRPFVIVVVVLLLIAAGFYGYRVWLHNQPVHVPATLAGVARTQGTADAVIAGQIEKSIQDHNPGLKIEVGAYADPASDRVLFAGAARGRSNVSGDFAEVGGQVGTPTKVGSSTCATGRQVALTLCERSEGDLTVFAMSVHRNGQADTQQQVAALVDEVWRQI